MSPTDRAQMRADVKLGLTRPQKRLLSKYFYDARGSELFDRITELPEYYLTRAERRLIESFARPWLQRTHPCTLVELGAGSGDKTRRLLDALPDGAVYVPVDISISYLEQIAGELGEDYPDLEIRPARADITSELALPPDLVRPLVIAFIGSTIGNFDRATALDLLTRVAAALGPDDRLLLGLDLRKDRATLEAAYNDAAGVTAEFNRNILHVLNRELGADFDVDAFDHVAFYNEELGRVEMHLAASRPQRVTVPDVGTFEFAQGETIHTEISCKYDRDSLEDTLGRAGLVLEEWVTEEPGYAMAVAARASA